MSQPNPQDTKPNGTEEQDLAQFVSAFSYLDKITVVISI
jgi:hypothetical protein